MYRTKLIDIKTYCVLINVKRILTTLWLIIHKYCKDIEEGDDLLSCITMDMLFYEELCSKDGKHGKPLITINKIMAIQNAMNILSCIH